MFAFGFDGLTYSFAICYPRLAQYCGSVEFVFHFLADDIELHFSHTAQDHLVGLGVLLESEGGVFVHEFVESRENFVLGAFVRAGNGEADNGLREFDGVEFYHVRRIAESIVGGSVVELGKRRYIARIYGVYGFLLLAAENDHRRYLLVLVRLNVKYAVAYRNFAAKNFEHKEFTDERVDYGLEYLRREFTGFVAIHFAVLVARGVTFLDGFAGRGEEVRDVI